MPKSALRTPALLLFGIYFLYGCVLIPAMEYVASDWVLLNTVLYDVLDVFLNLLEVLGACAAFGLVIHAVFTYTAKDCTRLYALLVGAVVFKYLTSLISVSILRGSLDLTGDFSSLLVAILIELAQPALVVWMTHCFTAKEREKNALPPATEGNAALFALKPLIALENPLKKAALWGTVLLTAVRLLAFIIDDIALGLAYTLADVPVTLLYCLILILIPSCVGYLLLLWCMRLCERVRLKQQAMQ